MTVFQPDTTILPPQQRELWCRLDATPDIFTLYGGTALALRLGHRISVDFDFFSNATFDPMKLANSVPYLEGAELVQVEPNTLTCRISGKEGSVMISFFGGLGLGKISEGDHPEGRLFHVASLLDLAGTKIAVVQQRAEVKDYLDIAALLRHGVQMETMLGAGRAVYGDQFNPLIALKALTYYEDVPDLPSVIRSELIQAVEALDVAKLPAIPTLIAPTN